MIAGTLEVQMLANMARLTEDMAKAKGMVGGAMKDIERSVAQAKAVLGALGIGLGVGYFVSLIKGTIDAADHLKDLSKSTNITVGDLAGLGLLAKQTGTDLDGLAKGINRMSVEMGKDPEKFRALGITAKTNKEAFQQFADIFNLLPDINQRNALAQAVFAKSWAELAPALSEGGAKIGEVMEKGARLSGITKEMTDQADEFNDKLAELTGTGGLFIRTVGPMLPILNALADDMLEVQNKTNDSNKSFSVLAETLRPLVVLAGNFAYVWRTIGISAAGAWEQMAGFKNGGIEGFLKARAIVKKILEDERAAFDAWEAKMMAAGPKAPSAGAGWVSGSDLPSGADPRAAAAAARAAAFLKEKKAAEDNDSAYRNLLKSLKEKLLTDRDLTEVNKLQLALDAMSAKQLAAITPAREAELKALAGKVDLMKQMKEAMENDAKNEEALAKMRQEGVQVISDYDKKRIEAYDATQKTIEQLEFETKLIGLSTVEREQAIAVRALETSGITAQDSAYAGLVIRLKEAVGTKVAKQEAEADWLALWSTVESTGKTVFMHVFADGKSAFEGIGKAIKASVIDLLYQLTLKKWMISIGATLSGSMASSAASAAGAAGTGSSLLSGGSLLSNLGGIGNLIYGGIGGGVGSIGAAGIMTAAPVYEAGVMVAAAETASIASSAGVSAALSAIGPIGWAAMAVGAMAALGFFGGDSRTATPQMSGLGSTGTISRAGFSGQQWVASGSSPSDLWAGSQWSNLAPDTAAGFNTAIKKIFDDMTKQAQAAGIGVEALANLTVTMGATGQGVQQDMVTALNKTADTVAETLMPGIEALQQSGETLTQTFVRVTNAQIAYKAQLAATQRALFEQILQAQGNIGQYTTMIREDVLKTLDIVSQDLQKQLWAAEEAAAASASRTAAMQAYEVLAGSVSQKQLDRERALAEATDAATIVWLKAAYALQDIQAADAAHALALQQYDIAAGTLTQKDVDRQNALAAAYDDTTRTFLQMTYALQDSNAAATEAANAQAALAAQQKQLADAARALTQGNLSPLVTGEKLSVAQSSLQDIYQKALSGDSGAIGALPSAATDYLTQLRAMYASSSAYTAGFQMVMDMLARAGGVPGHAAGLAYVPKDDYFMRAHRGEAVLNAPQAASWRSGNTGITSADLAALRRDNQALRSDLQQLIAVVAAGDSANVAATQGIAKAQQDAAWRQEVKARKA